MCLGSFQKQKLQTFSILPSSSLFKDMYRDWVLYQDREATGWWKMACVPRRWLLGSPFPEPKESLKFAWLPNFLNCIYWPGQFCNPITPVWPLPSTINSHDPNLTPLSLLQPCSLRVCISLRKWDFSVWGRRGFPKLQGSCQQLEHPLAHLSSASAYVALNLVTRSLSWSYVTSVLGCD